MKGDAGGKYWGNFFEAERPEPIQPGRWYCIEAMLKDQGKTGAKA